MIIYIDKMKQTEREFVEQIKLLFLQETIILNPPRANMFLLIRVREER